MTTSQVSATRIIADANYDASALTHSRHEAGVSWAPDGSDCEAQYGAYAQNGKSGPLKRFAQNALPKAKERPQLARLLAGGR